MADSTKFNFCDVMTLVLYSSLVGTLITISDVTRNIAIVGHLANRGAIVENTEGGKTTATNR